MTKVRKYLDLWAKHFAFIISTEHADARGGFFTTRAADGVFIAVDDRGRLEGRCKTAVREQLKLAGIKIVGEGEWGGGATIPFGSPFDAKAGSRSKCTASKRRVDQRYVWFASLDPDDGGLWMDDRLAEIVAECVRRTVGNYRPSHFQVIHRDDV